MFKKFISLEWKQFKRSPYFQTGQVLNGFLVLLALFFGGLALMLGINAYDGIIEAFPGSDPLVIVNNVLIFWVLADLTMRYYLQQLPVKNIKPYMAMNIRRSNIIHYLLKKSATSFFNFLPLLFFLPFSIVLLKEGYKPANVICWFISMMCFVFSFNYLNFLLNKNIKVFYGCITLLLALITLEYFGIFKISIPAGYFFNTLYSRPVILLIPFLLLLFLYRINYQFLRKGFYLDDAVSRKSTTVQSEELRWLDRFGDIAPFLKNDLRLIRRNARTNQVVLTSVLFTFYGWIFFSDIASLAPTVFASIFVTGGFLFTFGQLVPAWDSEYYKLLMCQNISYRKYLESKWYLMVLSVFISLLLCTQYLYFGWKIFGIIIACAIFNVGLNSFITLIGGSLNRQPVVLTERAKPFSNTQAFSLSQLLIAFPKILGPVMIFYIPYKIWSFEIGLIVLAGSGVLGIFFRNFFLNQIEKIYQKEKYKTIAAFDSDK